MFQSARHVTESLLHQLSRMEQDSIPQCARVLDQRAVEKLDSQIFAAIKKA